MKVTVGDLGSVGGIVKIVQAARKARLLNGSEADALSVAALAQYAIRVGKDPVGLFCQRLFRRKFDGITAADEDRARKVVGGVSL